MKFRYARKVNLDSSKRDSGGGGGGSGGRGGEEEGVGNLKAAERERQRRAAGMEELSFDTAEESKRLEYKTQWFGHDAFRVGQSGSCVGDFAARRIECRGYRCGQLRLTCSILAGRKWLPQPKQPFEVQPFGEGNPRIFGSTAVTQYNVRGDMATCPENMVLTGIKCSGHHCRYKALLCSWFDNVECSLSNTKLAAREHNWHFATAASAIQEQAQYCITD